MNYKLEYHYTDNQIGWNFIHLKTTVTDYELRKIVNKKFADTIVRKEKVYGTKIDKTSIPISVYLYPMKFVGTGCLKVIKEKRVKIK